MTTDVDGLLSGLDVSRETLERLAHYEALLKQWNPKINLVSRSSMDDFWTRHMLDSLQLYRLAPKTESWLDLGSGGGFPGLVCAIMAMQHDAGTQFTLIESDQRKSVFLRTIIRELGAPARVISKRIEAVAPVGAGVLTARALADLDGLLAYCDRHLSPTGVALFPKGVNWKNEVAEARKRWNFTAEALTSLTEPNAVILKIHGVARV
ncbi:16S rRNA (guanine527-N7)-methyltransferase [Cribrihabitans marinus]|uniref:Ribosomal RNA small subunit methyltransferase G n=1 Tax=Cribrihabitans marinus TaxID=1227549 RepID=A0A1H6YRC7_9RHOB|nr:16S rRNA (guanine(527)-N(7))-methyltransferase RsmG [Cribrihabitans marinus]GGH29122.1 ribosomal RNA small subunit methyltransferase G [Cribrihabitans marinus]SEJ39880.1 16S rRNA (guanine527-N7)-methyltransferase [Cribrihabitans marinus]